MEKKPATLLYPLPVVLVTTADADGRPNIMTVAWTGVVCSEPPMLSVSIRPSRYSYGLLKASGEFVVNVPSADHLRQVDYCGMVTGAQVDKFAATGFTPVPASRVRPPLIAECPVNLECEVQQRIELGSHDLFVARIVACHVEDSCLNEKGRLDVARVRPFAYNGALSYWSVKEELGRYGFSQK